jgi:ribosomal protein RSM22 (predicted rRNA methylase)
MLVVSHVLNELSAEAHARLMILASQASEILWVEAGTHADSRMLSGVREALRGQFSVVAPCPHSEACGVLAKENERHWCHFFTSFPSHAAQDARWSQLGRELGIDLRALPYSFLAMQNAPFASSEGARFIGTPVEKKGHFEVLVCEACGVRELCAQKRDVPELFKALRKCRQAPAYRIEVEVGKITAAAEL